VQFFLAIRARVAFAPGAHEQNEVPRLVRKNNRTEIRSRWATAPQPTHILAFLAACFLLFLPSCGGGSGLTVDFANRDGLTAQLAPNIMGSVGSDFGPQNPYVYSMLGAAGFAYVRVNALVPDVFSSPTPNWTFIDPLLASIQQSRMKVLLILTYTPTWLQPANNPCLSVGSDPSHAPPADLSAYAAIAAAYVKHMDSTFPGLVDAYEIWNEPDSEVWFCPPDPTPSGHIQSYLNIYSAIGPAMRLQAVADGVTIKIGGPAIADGTNPDNLRAWISSLVTNPNSAPYVDFISYHDYAGPATLAASITWDTTTPSLLSLTTGNPANLGGYAASYQMADALVRAGSQPNATATPIFITEFNTFTNGQGDCCANSPTYAPVWNALVISELLNAVSKGGAQRAVSGLYYYATAAPWSRQCLVGQIDIAMDCAWNLDQPLEGYPQYHTFELIFAPEHLDLKDGGFIASIQNGVAGIAAAAFYTASSDSVVLINTSGTELRQVPIHLDNVGLGPNESILMFLLNSANTSILRRTLNAPQEDGGYALHLDIPPYSVVGLSVHRSQ
jgi:hypothetical protein